MTEEDLMQKSKVGLWFLGAKGSIAVATVAGIAAIRHGLSGKTGLVTELPEYEKITLPPLSSFVFGGHEIRRNSLLSTIETLNQSTNLIPRMWLEEIAEELQAYEAQIKPGILNGMTAPILNTLGHSLDDVRNNCLNDTVDKICQDLRMFRSQNNLDSIVVINVMSTEPARLNAPVEWEDINSFEEAINKNASELFGPTQIYTYAALKERCAFVNFTPTPATEIPALFEMAKLVGVPHAGKDGKTGETLIKSQLAPLFANRNLRVNSWTGFNILGNSDGAVLQHDEVKRSKQTTKDLTLRSILGSAPDTLVGIDYVPSLGDKKVAWDYIHFSGWLGSQGQLSFQWEAADTALAAPLIVDLGRFMARAQLNNEVGLIDYLAPFFKSPIGAEVFSFDDQNKLLFNHFRTTKI